MVRAIVAGESHHYQYAKKADTMVGFFLMNQMLVA